VEGAARRAGRLLDTAASRVQDTALDAPQAPDAPDAATDKSAAVDNLRKAATALALDLDTTQEGRLDQLPDTLGATLFAVGEAAGSCAEAVRAIAKRLEDDPSQQAAAKMAVAILDDLHTSAGRILETFGEPIAERRDVVWLDRPASEDSRRPTTLRVAPLEVGGVLRERLFGDRTVALTSATLVLGGSFTPLAIQWGLPANSAKPAAADDTENEGQGLQWTGVDVGSPFDHPRCGILYVAKHLPTPGRDCLKESYLTEIAELIDAAGGRTLGLFSSMRAAVQAAEQLRDKIGYPLFCQGDDVTAQLVKQFAADERACLFGTLSLWQGVDVPGSSLSLVIIDRIPFPRPDDPLSSARQRAVAAHGGNGFMTVAASQAALLLAQGAGRLLRTMTDRGVVAVLDPRLVTARYGDFLRKSLPPFWTTTDPALVRAALKRLDSASLAEKD
jgi:ATP-dependent DNA helicase DinG